MSLIGICRIYFFYSPDPPEIRSNQWKIGKKGIWNKFPVAIFRNIEICFDSRIYFKLKDLQENFKIFVGKCENLKWFFMEFCGVYMKSFGKLKKSLMKIS